MRPFRFAGLLALALAACAPARTATAPVAPPPPARAPAVSAEAPDSARAPAAPAPVLSAAPEHWWLRDAATDRIPGIGAERAYRELLAGRQPKRTVVVAIIDSGVEVGHEDLRGHVWTNAREVPGNGKDDDGNGYVDDVHGWNFIGGRDGRHVEHDTYELTRLYARYRARFEGARADTLSASARAELEEYRKIRAEFEAERTEAAETLERIQEIGTMREQVTALLREFLGADTLSTERVAAIRTTRPDVAQARAVYLQLAEAGLDEAAIAEARAAYEGRLRYGLDPAFDPRPIVGDDTTDIAERHYGNPGVAGAAPDHGTMVAGIVGARRGNGLGIDGIAPDVRLMAIRAVPDGDERDKDVANAIRYAVDNGAHIINMSFGKAFSPHKAAVDEAVRYADARGVLLVHAAGNDGADLESSPNFPNRYFLKGDTARLWIEVGASSWRGGEGLAAPFSNFGRTRVDVFAPGVDIRSTAPGNAYRSQSGTSFAAPVVSGLAALLMAYFPELDAAAVKRIILETATPYRDLAVTPPGQERGRVRFGDLSATGAVVNAYEAIRRAAQQGGQTRN